MRSRTDTLWSRLIHIRGVQSLFFLIVTGAIFAAMTIAIRLPQLGPIDLDATLDLQQWRNPTLDTIFFTFTAVGNALTLLVIAVTVAAIYLAKGRRLVALTIMLSLLSLPLNNVIKYFIDRPRPSEDQVQVLLERTGLSFPSGHSMASAVVFGFLAALVWLTSKPDKWWRYAGTLALALVPCLVAVSRVYVGAHWMSDVIAGLAAGAFLLVPLVALYKHWHRVTPKEDADKRLPDKLDDRDVEREIGTAEHGAGLAQPRPHH